VLGLDGEVVAMANAVNVSGQGIAFAQPTEAVEAALPRLWPEPMPRGSWLGVHAREGATGVGVAAVLPRSPAEAGGLRTGDTITAMDGRDATAVRALASRLALSLPGARAAVHLVRDGKPLVVHVRSGAPPAAQDAALRPPAPPLCPWTFSPRQHRATPRHSMGEKTKKKTWARKAKGNGKKACTAAGCKHAYRAKGYCFFHYSKWRKGELPHTRYRTCSKGECRTQVLRAGLCEKHFNETYKKDAA